MHASSVVLKTFLVLAIELQAIFTCIQNTFKYNVKLSTSSNLWGTSSVLSLEQYGTLVLNNHMYRDHQPHVARMVLGGRSGRSGGELISSHHHCCIETLFHSVLNLVHPAPTDLSTPTLHLAVFPVLC